MRRSEAGCVPAVRLPFSRGGPGYERGPGCRASGAVAGPRVSAGRCRGRAKARRAAGSGVGGTAGAGAGAEGSPGAAVTAAGGGRRDPEGASFAAADAFFRSAQSRTVTHPGRGRARDGVVEEEWGPQAQGAAAAAAAVELGPHSHTLSLSIAPQSCRLHSVTQTRATGRASSYPGTD